MGNTAAAAEAQRFTPLDWGLFTGLALTWGSSFLFIAVGLEAFSPPLIAALRILFGAVTLAAIPAARARVPRAAWPRIILLGVLWMAVPLLLFPFAQQTVSSSLAGMINGAVPLTTAFVAALLARRLPPSHHRFGLGLGFAGVVAISLPAMQGAEASVVGVLLLVAAIFCYGISLNIAGPLQREHGALPVVLRAQLVALLLLTPFGAAGLGSATFQLSSLLAIVALGMAGTGLAFAAMTTLVGRVGATRASVAIYFVPIVAILLGVVVRNETVALLQLAGTGLVVAGAYLTSRTAKPVAPAADEEPEPVTADAAA